MTRPQSRKDFIDLCERNAETPRNLISLGESREESDKSIPKSSPPLQDFVHVGADDDILSKPSSLIRSEPGYLVVWDSRTVHCNSPALVASTDISRTYNSGDDQFVAASSTSSEQQ